MCMYACVCVHMHTCVYVGGWVMFCLNLCITLLHAYVQSGKKLLYIYSI